MEDMQPPLYLTLALERIGLENRSVWNTHEKTAATLIEGDTWAYQEVWKINRKGSTN
jgi:hypothetical protein